MTWLAVIAAAIVFFVIGVRVGARRGDEAEPLVAPVPVGPVADGQIVSVERLRDALNQLDIGVVVAASDGKVLYRNDAASAFSGTHVGAIVDDHLRRVLQRARSGHRIDDVVDLHGPPRLTLALVAEPMPDGSAVATIHDVSERVRIDAMRTDFVANISHELKTPVGAIAVLAEALADENDPVVVERVTERMVEEAHRAVQTIDDLLELSRIESAQRHDEIVDVAAVVHAAIARGRVSDVGRGVTVEADEVPADLCVHADGRQLVSALGNLVENAVKYSHDGGVVTVRTSLRPESVDIVVADHGVGIPPRDLARIFERFYRVDKARSRETGGTGLGLAIVRHIANNHGGDILVDSQEGTGSTFTFRLPVSLVVVDQPPPLAAQPQEAPNMTEARA